MKSSHIIIYAKIEIQNINTKQIFCIETHLYRCTKKDNTELKKKCLRLLKLNSNKVNEYEIINIDWENSRLVGVTCF